ncbi:MAG: RND family transporter [Lachnospiraceae bacterium]
MRKFYSGIVHRRKVIMAIFLFLFVVSLGLGKMVKVNYDMNDYLPEETQSTVSIDVMQEEFDEGIPNARVMIRDVTIPQALQYKEQLEHIPGVTSVTWLDDAVDLDVPLVNLDSETVENYYQDHTALFSVTIEESKRISAVADIRTLIGEENAMTGSAVSTALSTTNTVSEIAKISIIAVLFVLFVLLLTTNSWADPFLILIGLGVAIVINNGTNLIFGEISFVTNAAGSILQLAVSLDYSVFLLHRFEECYQENPNENEAMVDALCKSTSSIFSSGLTTVIGFLALVLMQYGIGPDLGLALAKGVALSLITVFCFMPALLLCTFRLSKRFRHTPIVSPFQGIGKVLQKVCFPMMILFLIVIAPSYLASNANTYLYGSSEIFGEDTQYGRDTNAIWDTFGKNDTYVILVPKGDMATEAKLSDELHRYPEVTNIISYVDLVGAEIPTAYLDEETVSKFMSDKYSRLIVSVEVPYEGEDTFALVKNIRQTVQKYYPKESYLAGEGVSTYDLMKTITSDMLRVNLIAIGAVFLVLLLTLRSVALPVILVLCIETAIWLNLAIPYFMGTPIYYIAYLIISSIQLGATVDYAILMTERFRENRLQMERKEAVVRTISDVAISILTSGSVLTVVGLLLGWMSSNQLLAQLGIFIGRGAILSLLIVFLVLPGFLYIYDRFRRKRV